MSEPIDNELYVDLYPYAVQLTGELFDPRDHDVRASEIGLRPMATDVYLRAHQEKLVRDGWLECPHNDGRIRISLKGCQFMGIVMTDED